MDLRDLEQRAHEIALSDLDLEGTCLAFDALLRRAVPYAVAAWSTHDPATGLFTSCTMSGLPKDLGREAQLFRYEFRDDEPNTFASLFGQGITVAVLSETTGGRVEQAARFRELLHGFGCTDELRAVLWADGRPWGSVCIYSGDRLFTREDVARVAAVAPQAAHALRLVLLRAAATRPEAVDDPPGILRVTAKGAVEAVTAPARRWLRAGGDELMTAANAVAAAVRGHGDWDGATSRMTLPGSRVLSLHAARLVDDAGDVVVIVDAARPAEVAAMLVEAYGLTRRQRDVLGLLLLGNSLTQIARRLEISEHTVNDHRKSIYRRVGVNSRGELAARLQADRYDVHTHAGVPPSPYGGFLTS